MSAPPPVGSDEATGKVSADSTKKEGKNGRQRKADDGRGGARTNPAERETEGTMTTREAAQFLGISTDRIRRLAEAGLLTSGKPGPNTTLFERSEIEDYKVKLLTDPSQGIGLVLGQIVKIATAQQAHIERQYKLATAPLQQIFRMMRKDKRLDRKAIRDLEKRLRDQQEITETARSEAHDRLLKHVAFEATQRRIDRGLESLTSLFPMVKPWIATKMGAPMSDGQESALVDYFGNFSPDEVARIVHALDASGSREKSMMIAALYEQIQDEKRAKAAKVEAEAKKREQSTIQDPMGPKPEATKPAPQESSAP